MALRGNTAPKLLVPKFVLRCSYDYEAALRKGVTTALEQFKAIFMDLGMGRDYLVAVTGST